MATETINRYKKARKIADHLQPLLEAGLLKELPVELTVLAENTLQVTLGLSNPPSHDTWTLARYLIEEGR